MRTTLHDLRQTLAGGRKLPMLTCYDASFASLFDEAGINLLLIGDSLGMVVQGHETTLPVTLADVAYHTAAVARGSKNAFIISDLPFGSYQASPAQAFESAVALMSAGAQMVKLEGGSEMAETCRFLVARGVPVCAHIGLTPQSVHQFGGFRVQGKTPEAAQRLVDDAKELDAAGCAMVVIEAVPSAAADLICAAVKMITIGIGASPACDGQVLVLHDALGIGVGKRPKFVHNFLAGQGSVQEALKAYADAVISGTFPAEQHLYA